MRAAQRCVVFGATGCLGGWLVPVLLDVGHRVRVVARDPGKLTDLPWRARIEVVRGDDTDTDSVERGVAGQDVAFYLVHSMNQRDFVELDRRAARVIAGAARAAKVRRA